MTKNNSSNSKRRSTDYREKDQRKLSKELSEDKPVEDLDEEPNSGFSNWLKTGDGVEYMRTFVIINSLIVFTTITWPQLEKMFAIIKEYWDEYNE